MKTKFVAKTNLHITHPNYKLKCGKVTNDHHYRPQRSCGQGYVFTRVCDSVNRGGSPPHPPPTPDQADPPGPRRHPPRDQGEPPRDQAHPPTKETPPPGPGTPPRKNTAAYGQ